MKERKKERKKEDFTYFGGKTWLASLLNFWHFTLPDWKTIPVNLVLTICLAKVITKSESTFCRVKTIGQVFFLLDYLLQHKKKERKKILNILEAKLG
jgi:hypothetical protein